MDHNRYSNDYSEYNLKRLSALLARGAKGADTEDKARLLIQKYGVLEDIFAAPDDELRALVGESLACYIRVVGAICSRRVTDLFELGRRHTRAEIAEYLKAKFMCESNETVIALFVDDEGCVRDSRVVARGTVNMSDVTPRKIIEASIETGCRRVILAHNHPMGVAKPSSEDIATTNALADILTRAAVTLEYHVVVAGSDCEIVCADHNYIDR